MLYTKFNSPVIYSPSFKPGCVSPAIVYYTLYSLVGIFYKLLINIVTDFYPDQCF